MGIRAEKIIVGMPRTAASAGGINAGSIFCFHSPFKSSTYVGIRMNEHSFILYQTGFRTVKQKHQTHEVLSHASPAMCISGMPSARMGRSSDKELPEKRPVSGSNSGGQGGGCGVQHPPRYDR
jgi:hypothetical protein